MSWDYLPPTVFNCFLQVMADQLAGPSDSVEAIGQSIENPAMLPIIIRAARRLQPQLHIRALKSLNYHLLSKCVLVSVLFSFLCAFFLCQVLRSAPFTVHTFIPVSLGCLFSRTVSRFRSCFFSFTCSPNNCYVALGFAHGWQTSLFHNLISVCVRPFPGRLCSDTAYMPIMMLLKFHSLARVCLSICSRKRTFARSCELLCQLGVNHSFPRNAFE